MDRINIGVFSEHILLQEGICCLIENIQGLIILFKENNLSKLISSCNIHNLHILIIHHNNLDNSFMNLISQLISKYPKLKILILSSEDNERNILRTIKAGAKGFLAKDSSSSDLLEAIYTLRGGHDYYSKSITQLLLHKYIVDLKSGDTSNEKDISCLSNRELEVLKLWGSSYTNSEISEELFISVRTVESHKNHIMQKLNMKTAVDLVKFAIRNSIIEV